MNYPLFIAYDEMQAKPEMRIRLLEDTDGDGVFDRGKVFADKISMTMGALWYRGSLYVGAPPDFLRFDDTDGYPRRRRSEPRTHFWYIRFVKSSDRAAHRIDS